MCTVSWWFTPNGNYELFFNRDEQKSRLAGDAPRLFQRDGVSFLAPTDPARGGSWLAVNEFGVSVGLLNFYAENGAAAAHRTPETPSRGELVLKCATASSPREAIDRAAHTELGRYAPFHLLALAPRSEICLLTWDGNMLEQADGGVEPPLTSSSFQTESVIFARRHQFSLLTANVRPGERPLLERFHNQHHPARGAFSVLMKRSDACTVSQTHVAVTLTDARMTYRPIDWNNDPIPGPACESRLLIRLASTLVT